MANESREELLSWWAEVEGQFELDQSPDWRPLTEHELNRLRGFGNGSENWDLIRVKDGFEPHRYKNNVFSGHCFLSNAGQAGVSWVHLTEVILDDGVVISGTREISHVVIGKGCRVVGCGSLKGGEEAFWSPFLPIEMGTEMGHRRVWVHPHVRLDEISSWVMEGLSASTSEEVMKKSGLPEKVSRSVLMPGCDLEGLVRAFGFCLGHSTKVRDAALIENVVSISGPGEEVHLGSGVILRDVQLMWGAGVQDQAQLQAVRVGEQSHLGLKVTVVQSCIGPDNHIDRGEVAASLLGPMVGLHHQALLIGSIWPGGRGNVGYGANVGSNHTGKKPDQEFLPGEGCFLGLDVTVKFPSNFLASPYSLLASGVKAQAQKIEMPFSLLLPGGDSSVGEGQKGRNELRPGWVYLHNSYLIHRNEMKFTHRRRSRRTQWDPRPLRPEWIPDVFRALENLEQLEGKDVYTEKDCPALGLNFLSSSGLEDGKKAYRILFLHLIRIALLDGEVVEEQILVKARGLGLEEGEAFLRKGLKEDLERMLNSAKRALKRDSSRGEAIMPDYGHGHPAPKHDPVLLDLESRIKEL